MSSTQVSGDTANGGGPATVPLRFEVAVLPVTDVDRAKAFYQRLGWRLDADFPFEDGWRIVQFTPPGSPASIQFGSGLTTQPPGTSQALYLVVGDIDAARAELTSHAPGRDPDGRSYGSFASFADPDGNQWLLQEITERLPGRD
jgi:catechol 2,3-dioxygenase-like lactoylglutathione lyase family enzyme